MKSSRAMLLAALLLSTPVVVFGGQAPTPQTENLTPVTPPQPTTAPQATEAGMLSKAYAFVTAPAVFALTTAPDWCSKQTLHRLAALGLFKDTKVAAFLTNPYTGRVVFLSAAAYAIYKLHQMANAEEINEEPVFGDEYGN